MIVLRPSLCLMLLILIQMLALSASYAQEAPELQVNSKRYIVVDVDNGDVFAQKDARDHVAIASLTKLFTAVQALDMAPLDTPITTADSDLRSPEGDYFGTSGTLMGFGVDETYTLEDMIYGMLLPSGNDAANAIARTLGEQPGDSSEQATQRFMDLMNQRIQDMGLKDTHLVNPHGWGVPGHYSSAWDIATFTRLIALRPELVKIMGSRSYTTSNGYLTFSNTNKLLSEYDLVLGGKTGYDLDAGYCLVNIAGKGDLRMIAVTLDGIAPGDWYDDNRALLEYGFEQKVSLAASARQFTGDVAGYTDPAVMEFGRFAVSSGSFTATGSDPGFSPSRSSGVPAASRPSLTAVQSPSRTGSSIGGDIAAWILASAVIALVAFRGLWAFRRDTSSKRGIDRRSGDS